MVIGIGVKIGAANSVAVAASERAWEDTVTMTTPVPAGGDDLVERLGDPVPLIDADGAVIDPAGSYADAIATMIASLDLDSGTASDSDPGAADQVICVTHPDTWSEQARDDAARSTAAHPDLAGKDITWVGESQAALTAVEHSNGSFDGAVVVTYDLGATGLTVSVLDSGTGEGGSSAELLSRPLHVDTISGREFDRLVLGEVLAVTGTGSHTLPAFATPEAVDELADLRRACGQAKESLSVDTETVVDVAFGGETTQARLVRDEVEDLLRAPILESVSLVREAVADAGVEFSRVSAVLLTGGGASIPLVTELLSSSLRLPVIVDPDPASATAAGAALLAQQAAASTPAASAPAESDPAAATADVPSEDDDLPAPRTIRDLTPAPITPIAEAAPRWSRGRRGTLVLAGTAAAVLIGAAGLSVGTNLIGSTGQSTPPPAGAATTSVTRGPGTPGAGATGTVGGAGTDAQGTAPEMGQAGGAPAAGTQAQIQAPAAGDAGAGSAAVAGDSGGSAPGTSSGGGSTDGGSTGTGGSTATGGGDTGGSTGGDSSGGAGGGDTSGGTSGGSNLPSLGDVGGKITDGVGGLLQVPGNVLQGAGNAVCSIACSGKSG